MAENDKLVDLSEFGLSDAELFAHYDNDEMESERITAPRYSYWKSVFRVFFRKKINIFFIVLISLIIVFAYIYPLIIRYDPEVDPWKFVSVSEAKHLNPAEAVRYHGFSIHWILGSGAQGQSTFDSIWYGSSISISLALICAAINMFIGILIGAVWGFSKKVDIVMTEIFNVVGNVPYVLIISVLVRILTGSFWALVFALTITGWLGIAYFIRTQVIIIRDREYNLASKCLGTSIFRIAMRNILPFMTSIIMTLLATEIPSYISYEVYLSYIGIGMKEMSLGKIIESTQPFMFVKAWGFEYWSPVVIASVITVVLYVVGQNLGDASDPRTHM
jgi:oligopeptide transport system permease protein